MVTACNFRHTSPSMQQDLEVRNLPRELGKGHHCSLKDKLNCDNYRGISLLSLAGKVFCPILHNRTKPKTEEILCESQAGFRPGRSTIDQLFTPRQIIEKYTKIGNPLFHCYIDYQKAFDTVWQEGLWATMRHLGYPRQDSETTPGLV